MYLSQVDLVGFKSFAHKTSIKFDDGITAIVGPNGCGKTNIVDAIRWVLGEQKSSVLRSERMENVIFGGTMNRRRLGYAEVALVIENTKNILPIEYSQIMISRRLYRSGESEYLLNKQVCRLKEISNLLMDSGMGADAYSIIELSMIEQLLNDSDDFRNRLFEEAAGITRYKTRRQETLRKLDATRQDLIRVKDIINEIERNVGSLKSQVNRAKKYEKLKEEVVSVEKLYYVCKRRDLSNRKKPMETELSSLSNSLSGLSGKFSKGKASFEKAQNKIIEKQDLLAKAQDDLNQYSDRVRAVDNTIATLKERLAAMSETERRLEEELAGLSEKLNDTNSKRVLAEKVYETGKNDLKSADDMLKNFENDRNKFLVGYKRKKELFLEKSQKIFDIVKNLEETKRKKDALNRESHEKNTRLSELRTIKSKSLDRFGKLSGSVQEHLDNQGNLEKKLKDLKKEKAFLIQSQETITKEILNYVQKENELKVSYEANNARVQFLTNLIEEHGDLPGGVTSILKAKEKLKGIFGTIADHISVPEPYRYAVESVLGEQAHYVVVDTLDNITCAIDFLRSSRGGRATFIALDSIKNEPEISVPKSAGKEFKPGINIIDKINMDNKIKPVIKVLLGDVVFVDDEVLSKYTLDSRSYHQRFVNASGEIHSAGYLHSGGSAKDSSTGIIGRNERLSELRKLIKKIESQLEVINSALKNGDEKNEVLLDTISKNAQSLESVSGEFESVNRSLDIMHYEKEQIEQELEKLDSEAKQAELFKKDFSSLKELDREIFELQKNQDKLQDESAVFQSEVKALESERDSIEIKYSDYKAQSARFKEALLSSQKDSARLDLFLREIENDIQERKIALQETKEQKKETNKKIEERNETLENLVNEQHNYEEKVLVSREELHAFQEEKRSEFDGFMTVENEIAGLRDRIQNQKTDLLEIQNKLDFLDERMREKGIDIKTIVYENGDYDQDELDQKKQRLIQKLEAIGPVNLEALEEYNREKERVQFLINQSHDLEDSEKTLIETINKINHTAHERFVQTFQLVKDNFKSVFGSFFGEGEADLQIVETDDPINSKIEVFAQPFGKKVQSIALLSGGEKSLTALAILLAIYKVKPSPFCILDEVDAPLDDANISRFIAMLKKYSFDTQFIVVTHNKKTMEAAHNLYGVTMEESGISKLISVRMNHEDNSTNTDEIDPAAEIVGAH